MSDRERPTPFDIALSHRVSRAGDLPALDDMLRALGNPLRRRIWDRLREPAREGELVVELGVSKHVIHHHVQTLVRLGCVEVVERRQHRSVYKATVMWGVSLEPTVTTVTFVALDGREWTAD